MEKQLTTLALALSLCSLANAADEMTVISYGGISKTVQTEVFYQPFEAAHHVKLIAGEYNGEMARIKAMVDTRSVNWDVVQVESDKLVRGCEEGLFEPLDPQRLGKPADFVPGTFSGCGAGLPDGDVTVVSATGKPLGAVTFRRLAEAMVNGQEQPNLREQGMALVR